LAPLVWRLRSLRARAGPRRCGGGASWPEASGHGPDPCARRAGPADGGDDGRGADRPHARPRRAAAKGTSMTFTIGYLIGSLSSGSINRTLAGALVRLAPDDLELREIPIKDLPLYSDDYDDAYPPEGTALKEAIEGADGLLIVSPEYNRSIPGALKNAID